MALIEDVDAVFDGRKTIVGHLTFDCLLNCLDGVERSDGLLTFVTSNDPAKLDAALGGPAGKSARPGRIDEIVRLGPMSEAGRRHVADRVLRDFPAGVSEDIVDAGNGDTGAQFERRCVEAATAAKWGKQRIPDTDFTYRLAMERSADLKIYGGNGHA